MKKLHLFLSALALMAFVACGDDENDYQIGGKKGTETPVQPDDRQAAGPEIAKYNLEFPALKGGNSVVIVHSGILNDKLNKSGVNYSVEWDTNINAQRWSCYQMYADIIASKTPSNNVSRYSADNDGSLSPECQYPNDLDIPSQYQLTIDPYKYSGYDHGHICPSADRQRAEEANYQTFYITNMQPQVGKLFNQGIWENMENQLRTWTALFDTMFVCKGGTIDKAEHIIEYVCQKSHQATRINNNHVPVPKYFFMAVLGKKGTSFKATGFWIAQDQNSYSTDLKSYAVTIQALQSKTGIDFFCNLPDDIETEVENVSQAKMESEWTWYK